MRRIITSVALISATAVWPALTRNLESWRSAFRSSGQNPKPQLALFDFPCSAS